MATTKWCGIRLTRLTEEVEVPPEPGDRYRTFRAGRRRSYIAGVRVPSGLFERLVRCLRTDRWRPS